MKKLLKSILTSLAALLLISCGSSLMDFGENKLSAGISSVTKSTGFGIPASPEAIAAMNLKIGSYFNGQYASNPQALMGAQTAANGARTVMPQTLGSSNAAKQVFRFYNSNSGAHFYTMSEAERDYVKQTYPFFSFEGGKFFAYPDADAALSPVYRFYNNITATHFYTINAAEKDHVQATWPEIFTYEGISWNASKVGGENWAPVYRFYNSRTGTHFYTANSAEKDHILATWNWFIFEGIAYYVKVPSTSPAPVQVNTQAAVLNTSVITATEGYLTKLDAIGNFKSSAGHTWTFNQLFMHNGRAYKVVGVIVNQDGTTNLSTRQARLDEVYDDLKFTFKANALAYDSNSQPIGVTQLASMSANRVKSRQMAGNGQSIQAQIGITDIQCLIPKAVSEGTLTNSDIEWGYSFELNNCSLGDLLQLPDALPNVRVDGSVKHTAEIKFEFDKKKNTNYTETSQSTELAVTFSGQLSASERAALKANKNICHERYGGLECEKTIPLTSFNRLIGYVPVTMEVGYGFSFTVDVNGTISHKYSSGVVTKKGLIEGVEINETNKTGGGWSTPITTAGYTGEANLFGFGFLDVGIGAEGLDLEAYLAKIESKAGAYGEVSLTASPTCMNYSAGLKIEGAFRMFKISDFSLINFEEEWKFPLLAKGSKPLDCNAPGKVQVGYVIAGKNYYTANLAASTDTTDVYDAGKFLISNPSANGKFTVDLSSTIGIKGVSTEYSVDMVPGTTSNASVDSFVSSPTNYVAPYVKVLINHGNTTYGDIVRFKIAAYDPNNRVATETSRIVEIRIEPSMSAAPKYRHYISTSGNEGYLANYWYGSSGSVLTANQAQSGYLEAAAGDKFVFSSQINNLDTGKDFVINSLEDRTNLRPKRLALLSKLDRAGSEQFFNFVEITDVVINSVNISPAEPTVGNLATFTITGEGLPANLAVNIPNCSTPVEVRSNGNIYRNNYSTGLRVFTCTPNASGEVVTATFGPNNFAKTFRIPPQTCPAGQTVVNGVCVTTPSGGGLIGKSLTIDYRYPDINTYLTGRSADPITVTVGNGVELPSYMTNPTFELDISANKIRISNYRYTGSPATVTTTAASFNGLVFTLPVSSGLQFASASLGSGTTAVSGITSSDISINSNQLRLNVENSQYNSSSVIEIDFTLQTSNATSGAFNIATDFSLATNPNGTWSYGYKYSNTAFQLFSTPTVNAYGVVGFNRWNTPSLGTEPHVLYNETNTSVKYGSLTLDAKALQMHPGMYGEIAVSRWTAPSTGTYQLNTLFKANDNTSTGVGILKNGVSIFNNSINGAGATAAYTASISVSVNDTLDFFVDQGASSNYIADSTGLAVSITPLAAGGSFSVPANLEAGTPFTAPAGVNSCSFSASGTWSLESGLSYSADGFGPNTSVPGILMYPGSGAALIAYKNGGYIHIGSSRTVSVNGGEQLRFMANDYTGAFGDNSGALSVTYTCN